VDLGDRLVMKKLGCFYVPLIHEWHGVSWKDAVLQIRLLSLYTWSSMFLPILFVTGDTLSGFNRHRGLTFIIAVLLVTYDWQ